MWMISMFNDQMKSNHNESGFSEEKKNKHKNAKKLCMRLCIHFIFVYFFFFSYGIKNNNIFKQIYL